MVQTPVLNAQGKQDADKGEDNDGEEDVFHTGAPLGALNMGAL